jgi:hypothetical protein
MLQTVLGSALGTAALTAGRGVVAAAGNGLSFAAELLRATADDGVHGQATNERGRIDLLRRIDELASRIRRQLAAAGIKLDQAVELTSDGVGGVAVASHHPQQGAIEEVLRSDVLLARDFHRLSQDCREFAAADPSSGIEATLKVLVRADPGNQY